ncbi:MAG TPA: alpha/beta hydrolase [Myxococcaceae bacterium]|nr:alpha/beta hydrolase [Myxococcaceae bacterium]
MSQRIGLSTGVELEYVCEGPPEAEAVLFLPGYTDSFASFALNLPALAERHRIYGLSLRGHGNSARPATGYSQAHFVDDVVAFMDAEGLTTAAVVGHSMGSLVAHKLASEHPSRVSRLVLIGSGPSAAGNPVVGELLGAVDALTDPVDPQFVREFQSSTFTRPVPATYLDAMVANSLKLPASVWQQTAHGFVAEDHTDALRHITAPTLLIWGDQDGFFGERDQQALLAAIPDARLSVYEGTGHAPHAEQPHRFNRELSDFLR